MQIYKHALIKYTFFFVILVAIDQLSKYLIRHYGGFYICNPDISWNIAINGYVFAIFWIVLVVILLFLLLKPTQIFNFQFSNKPQTTNYKLQTTNLSLMLILAGAISNIIDRIYYGCIIDFIDTRFWPIFNLADVFIVLGAISLLVRWKKI